jgi:hypothetical protein
MRIEDTYESRIYGLTNPIKAPGLVHLKDENDALILVPDFSLYGDFWQSVWEDDSEMSQHKPEIRSLVNWTVDNLKEQFRLEVERNLNNMKAKDRRPYVLRLVQKYKKTWDALPNYEKVFIHLESEEFQAVNQKRFQFREDLILFVSDLPPISDEEKSGAIVKKFGPGAELKFEIYKNELQAYFSFFVSLRGCDQLAKFTKEIFREYYISEFQEELSQPGEPKQLPEISERIPQPTRAKLQWNGEKEVLYDIFAQLLNTQNSKRDNFLIGNSVASLAQFVRENIEGYEDCDEVLRRLRELKNKDHERPKRFRIDLQAIRSK